MVELLLAKGADPNIGANNGITPLYWAALCGSKSIAELLLAHAADPNPPTKPGFSPLYMASLYGHKEVVELLLAKSVDPNASDQSACTALSGAIAGGHQEIVELFLSKGADVNARGACAPPVYLAASMGFTEITRLLIQHGANVNEKTEYGSTPLSIALERGQKAAAEWLVANGAELDLVAAAALGKRDRVESLLRTNPESVNAKSVYGKTALTEAAWWGHKEVAELLIGNGAEVNPKDKATTPLHAAADAGQVEVAELLLAKGADVNAMDARNRTPLHLAEASDQKEMTKFLRAHGAKELERIPMQGPFSAKFSNTPFDDALLFLVEITAKPVVVSPYAAGTVTFSFQGTMPEAVSAFDSAVQSNGWRLANVNDEHYKLVRLSETNIPAKVPRIQVLIHNNAVKVDGKAVPIEELSARVTELAKPDTEIWIDDRDPIRSSKDMTNLHWHTVLGHLPRVDASRIFRVYSPYARDRHERMPPLAAQPK